MFLKNRIQDNLKTGKTILFGSSDYTKHAQGLINKFGNENINEIMVFRKELSTGLKFALNAVSLGDFKKKCAELGYDKLYHLSMVIDTNKGRLLIEKNDVITCKERPQTSGDKINIPVNKKLTVFQLLNNTQKFMGGKYFVYSALHNNCQDYILSILKANSLNSSATQNFIKQNLEELFNERTRKIVNTTTEIGGRVNKVSSDYKSGHLLMKQHHHPQLMNVEEKEEADVVPLRKQEMLSRETKEAEEEKPKNSIEKDKE